MMDVREILSYLPHRYPFLMVDRILEMEPGTRIVGIKNVTYNEHFFQGHFPGKPVMPGVLIVEAMAQVGAILAHSSGSLTDENKVFMLTGLDRVKIKRAVEPGDQLRLELTSLKRRGPYWKMSGDASVDGKQVAHVELSAMEVDRE
ncbi:MAG: 3-hydroxyacyl-ACP dehydratase FabZ [Deltaproteobacteria bacterium]|nr:3-hydroxyacyl-ACP dehydratase FabZ [Deltaproteobacteria bacterium]